MNYLSIIILYLFISSCGTQSKSPKESMISDKLSIDTGIVILTKVEAHYFFPVTKDYLITRENYKTLDYNDGFLLINLGYESRMKLISQADTIIGSNFFKYSVPVRIEYYEKIQNPYATTDTICFMLNSVEKCLLFDDKAKFMSKISVLEN